MIRELKFRYLPFTPDKDSIIYVENEYDAEVNYFIQKYYEAIKRYAQRLGFQFIYLPYMANDFAKKGALHYYAPYIGFSANKPGLPSNWLLEYLENPSDKASVLPSLLYWDDAGKANIFTIRDSNFTQVIGKPSKMAQSSMLVEMDTDKDNNRKQESFLNNFKSDFGSINFDFVYNDTNKRASSFTTADDTFSIESRRIMEDVKEKIEQLRQMGIKEAVLESLIHKDEKLSRMIITKKLDIILPDYNDMKILMTPLHKAVYILFLRHPEGIMFSHLPDYRDELLSIYARIKDWFVTDRMQKSVVDVTDPLNNSINEKCARIREAFVSRFDERLAQNYVIDGNWGEAKRISLPRDMVIWQ